MTQHQPAIKGGWLEAKSPELVAAVPNLQSASVDVKLRVVEELRAKLEALREWDRWDPRTMDSVEVKTGYRLVERVSSKSYCGKLQVLPDGRIFSWSPDEGVSVWTKKPSGKWGAQILKDVSSDGVSCFQVLPDGEIFTGNASGIHIWNQLPDGEWKKTDIETEVGPIIRLQALPDGGIVAGSFGGNLWVSRRGATGLLGSKVLKGHDYVVSNLQVTPDGRIISGDLLGTILIWSRTAEEGWRHTSVGQHPGTLRTLSTCRGDVILSAGELGIRMWKESPSGEWEEQADGKDIWTGRGFVQFLPDGRIVCAGLQETIGIWSQSKQGAWTHQHIKAEQDTRCLQVLPDGRIISGHDDGIRIWDGTAS